MSWNFLSVQGFRSFKYLGSAVNQNNTIEEEIKGRIIAGNRAFYANQKMFQNKLLSKKSKLTLRRLMSYIYIYIYGAPILDVSRSHTTTQHSR